MLCCVVPCFVVLCRALLCCVVSCLVVLCCVVAVAVEEVLIHTSDQTRIFSPVEVMGPLFTI